MIKFNNFFIILWLNISVKIFVIYSLPSNTVRSVVREKDKFQNTSNDMVMNPDEISQITVVRSESRRVQSPHKKVLPISSALDLGAEPNIFSNFYRNSASNQAQSFFHSDPLESLNKVKPSIEKSNSVDDGVLGSGDFVVIRGGTFYPMDEELYHDENDDYDEYGGTGLDDSTEISPDDYIERYTLPEEQFAHFRDFADIKTPSEFGSSQFVVVYADENNSTEKHSSPNNILEQLELIDKEKEIEEKEVKKLSSFKSKLNRTKLEKNYKKFMGPKNSKYDSMIALS